MVTISPKFKVPNFDKYKGMNCPKNQLKMYCRKMSAHSRDEKLLIHFSKIAWPELRLFGTLIWKLPASVLGRT